MNQYYLETEMKNCRTEYLCGGKAGLFTLVEILMTIVIMTMLMVIAMPAFTEMMKGQGVEASARNLCQVFKLARSHAINNREYVAVLMPRANLPESYLHTSYKACEVVRNGSNYTFKRWIPGEGWNKLSAGVAITDINATTYDGGNGFTGADTISGVNCSDIGSSYSNVTLTGIVFKPTGQSNVSANVYVGEATYSGSLVTTNVAGNVMISVNKLTGRVSYGDE